MVVSNDEEVEITEFEAEEFDPSPGEALGELLVHLEDYTPTVPDAVAENYLKMAGFEAGVDPRIVRIISVTAQKFISDIANDALQHCKTRSNSQSGSHGSNKVTHALISMLWVENVSVSLQPLVLNVAQRLSQTTECLHLFKSWDHMLQG